MHSTTLALAGLALLSILPSGCKREAQPAAKGGSMPPVQVIAVEARTEPVVESLSLVGSVAPNEMVEIKSETEGTVEEVLFTEGQAVKKGQLLLHLEERKLAAAAAEAEANFKLSRANYERARQLLEDKLISQQEFDQAAATFQFNEAGLELKRQQLRDARIMAPFDGIIGTRQVSPGQVISRNQTLSWLVDLAIVKVEVKVPERYLQQLQIGRPLDFSVAAFPGEIFRGEVYFVSPQIDEGTRTALVKARITNPSGKLRGGMLASLELRLQLRDAAVVIPEPALMSSGDAFTVFVIDDQGLAQIRPVEVGLRLAGRAEVLKGISAGEKVVVEGSQKLRPGAPVKQAPPERAAPYKG